MRSIPIRARSDRLSERARRVAREIAVIALFVVLAIAMTWPLAANIDRAVVDPSDPFCMTWTIDWDYHATFSGAKLFDANIFAPAPRALAYSEHMYGVAMLLFPLFALGIAPLTIHNIAMIAAFAGCGYAMFLLCRDVTRSTAAGIVGGIAYAFVGFRFVHLMHLVYAWSFWLPLLLLCALRFVRRPSATTSVLLGAVIVMNGLTTMHWLVFGTSTVTLTLLVLALATGRFREPRFWILLALTYAASIAILLPFVLPYTHGESRDYTEAIGNSARWSDWLQVNPQSKLYGAFSRLGQQERTLFPGFSVLLLAAIGLAYRRRVSRLWPLDLAIACAAIAAALGVMMGGGSVAVVVLVPLLVTRVILSRGDDADARLSRLTTPHPPSAPSPLTRGEGLSMLVFREWFSSKVARGRVRGALATTSLWAAILWIAIGAWGARGVRGAMHTVLFDLVSAFRGIRVPARWAMISYVGLSLLAAAGVVVLIRNRGAIARGAIATVVCAITLFELRAAPIRFYMLPLERRELYSWLASQPIRGSILELPLTQSAAYEYMWRATVHHKPLVNGVSSFAPPHYDELTRMYETSPLPIALLDRLEADRCSLIVVHSGLLRERRPDVRQWLREGIDAGRIVFVRRFDAGLLPDYVFALTRVEPNIRASQDADNYVDTTGRTPNHSTFGNTDLAPDGVVRGPLDVSGWALSPSGVRRVNLLFDNGRVVIPADLSERPALSAAFPWYPKTRRPAFAKHFDAPPRGIRGDTNFQVEIIDGRGESRRLPPAFFSWYPLAKPLPWNEPELDRLLIRLGKDPNVVRPKLASGRAMIEDFAGALFSHEEVETDDAFVARVIATLLEQPAEPRTVSPYVRMLHHGTSRERVLRAIVSSRDFRAKYLV